MTREREFPVAASRTAVTELKLAFFKQVSREATQSKCMPPPLQVNWSGHDLDL